MNERRALSGLLCLMLMIPLAARAAAPQEDGLPGVDHHQHLLSPQSALLVNLPDAPTDVPAAVIALLAKYEAAWNDAAGLGPLYADTAVAFDCFGNEWVQDRD